VIRLRDVTLREGRDTPGVSFTGDDRMAIADGLVAAGVAEIEAVAPSRVLADLSFVRRWRAERSGATPAMTGLIYAASPSLEEEVAAAAALLDRVEIVVPLSPVRPPFEPEEKIATLDAALTACRAAGLEAGAGFPHACQQRERLAEFAHEAARRGASRVIVYDTNGGAEPDMVVATVGALARELGVPVWFHGHDDLGLATANGLAAVRAGASGLDVTVNGLGDRAGNASLEQLAVLLAIRGFETGVDLARLRALSRLVEERSGVPVSGLAPIVGAFVFAHRSPGHLGALTEFEAFAPELVGRERRVEEADQ
jgi:homocitrate synthase NifV